jgi:hypothetical protein
MGREQKRTCDPFVFCPAFAMLPVEPAARIPKPMLPRRQLAEVGRRPRDVVVEQLEHDAGAQFALMWMSNWFCMARQREKHARNGREVGVRRHWDHRKLCAQ